MLKYDTKSGHTSLLWGRSGVWVGGGLLTQTMPKPTVNTPTVNIPTVSIPTVNIPRVNILTTDKKTYPLARQSRKRGGGFARARPAKVARQECYYSVRFGS